MDGTLEKGGKVVVAWAWAGKGREMSSWNVLLKLKNWCRLGYNSRTDVYKLKCFVEIKELMKWAGFNSRTDVYMKVWKCVLFFIVIQCLRLKEEINKATKIDHLHEEVTGMVEALGTRVAGDESSSPYYIVFNVNLSPIYVKIVKRRHSRSVMSS